MKVFLDENLPPSMETYLMNFGHDVVHVRTINKTGTPDEELFEIAIQENRVFITQNGKHFIILVPPRIPNKKHFGLLWIKFNVTRKVAEEVSKKVHEFLSNGSIISDVIWNMDIGTMNIRSSYPKIRYLY